jgi:UDP-N-acetylglucosamine 2-epimerase (non-hydrolysing)
MKMAPVHKELLKHKSKFKHKIVHTGQHYDKKMSGIFFKELGLPRPHIYLGVGSKSHAEQAAQIMTEFEKVVLKEKPDLVLVYGDVNSTMAAAIVCAKTLINGKPVPAAHIEAGLRSFDKSMPEEINRMITDEICDYLFVTEESGIRNLMKEGKQKKQVFFTGNTMIDSLSHYLRNNSSNKVLKELAISADEYVLVTLHRPSNVDSKENLQKIINIFALINKLSPGKDIVFPVHPRTLKMIERFKLMKSFEGIKNLVITEPLGYLDFMNLTANAGYVLTDSGGIQEETTYLGIPCLTLRENTERPVTAEIGTNVICGLDIKKAGNEIKRIEAGRFKKGKVPQKWDGKASERIVQQILKF